jgi:hypothetical protein
MSSLENVNSDYKISLDIERDDPHRVHSEDQRVADKYKYILSTPSTELCRESKLIRSNPKESCLAWHTGSL